MTIAVVVRRATPEDLPALGRLGALLLRIHSEFDPQRFITLAGGADEGYARFLGGQLRHDDVAVFVAERQPGEVIGYVYVGLEPRSWKELRDAAGFIHDIVVDPSARGSGVAPLLLEAAFDWLRSRGAPRVILWTAEPNMPAQRLFAKEGFRRTMVEMTKEL